MYKRGEKCPLILVHGLWDTPLVFQRLLKKLEQEDLNIYTPRLPHNFGRKSLEELANELEMLIFNRFGSNKKIDLLGFSMGGIIGRIWIQKLGGFKRTCRFFSVGSPHRGTFTAHFLPSRLLDGVSEMRRDSSLIENLNNEYAMLETLKCSSFFCAWDLMVCPGWEATLPVGKCYSMPVITHRELITHPKSIDILVKAILKD